MYDEEFYKPKPANRWWRTHQRELDKLDVANDRYMLVEQEKHERFMMKSLSVLVGLGYSMEDIFKG